MHTTARPASCLGYSEVGAPGRGPSYAGHGSSFKGFSPAALK